MSGSARAARPVLVRLLSRVSGLLSQISFESLRESTLVSWEAARAGIITSSSRLSVRGKILLARKAVLVVTV